MTTFLLDNFTDTDSTTLQSHTGDGGNSWTVHSSFGTTIDLIVKTNRLNGNNNGGQGRTYYSSSTPGDVEYDVTATLYARSLSTNNKSAHFGGRFSTGAQTGYLVFAQVTSSSQITLTLYKYVAGTPTQLGSTYNITGVSAGNSFSIKLQILTASKKVFVDGVERITDSDDTITAAGTVVVGIPFATTADGLDFDAITAVDSTVNTGTASVTLPSLTITAYDAFNVDLTLPALTASGYTGAVGAVTLPALTISASGEPLSGAVVTLPLLTATGQFIGQSIGAGVLPALTVSGSGLMGNVATAALVLPLLTTASRAPASAALTLPALAVVGVGSSSGIATAVLVLPKLSLTAQLKVTNVLSASLSLRALTSSGVGLTGGRVSGQLTLPPLRATGAGLTGATATASLTLPLFTMAGLLATGGSASGQLVLPMLTLAAEFIDPVSGVFHGWAFNTRTKGLSRYSNFNFNSFANFNGAMLAAGSSGVVALEGTGDNGTRIDSVVTTAVSNFGSEQQKKLPRLYADYYAASGLTISATSFENGTYTYPLAPVSGRLIQQRRATMGLGLKSTHWQFTLRNVSGSDFRLESLTVYPEQCDRKVFQKG